MECLDVQVKVSVAICWFMVLLRETEHMQGLAVLSSLCLARSESTCLGIDAVLPVLTLVNVLPAHSPGPRNDFRASVCI